MKVPKARKLSSGNWFIQLRLGGESIGVTGATEKACTRDAASIKAEWLAKKKLPPAPPDPYPTLTAAIDNYVARKRRTLSQSTLRGYRAIQKNRFQDHMETHLEDLLHADWQNIINAELALAAPKTVVNAFKFVRTVIKAETNYEIPLDKITLPQIPKSNTAFLQPEEIKIFVAAIKDTRVAVSALLALSSLRISEISALRWENIPKNPKFIRVSGAVVRGEDSTWVRKRENKNLSSNRNVPIIIPELLDVIERDRKPSGPVMSHDQDDLRETVHRICQENQITDVTIHGLRHSFASLAYHLQVPEKIAMEIGGWSDPGTMHKIYTHIAQSDFARYQTAMSDFYSGKTDQKENAKPKKKR